MSAFRAELPLLHDRHTHVSFYAALAGAADLSGCRVLGEALEKLGEQKGPLRLGRGWRSNLYELPPAALDRLGPALVCNVSLHSFRMSAPARELLARDFPDIAAGIDDQDWVERHLPRVFSLFTASGAGGIPGFMERLAALGVWAAEDMLVCPEEAALLLARSYAGRVKLWAAPDVYRRLGQEAKKAVGGIKLFADGALGARTAALSGEYLRGGQGLLLHSRDELEGLLREAADLTGRVAVHAIGGAALEQLLSALERSGIPAGDLAVRIEHAQLIGPEQARRAKKLGAVLCMQPNFSSDSADYADRLPEECLRANNPFRMLIDGAGFVPGEDLLFGSDGMPHGARAALEAALFPPYPGQRLALAEFRAGYCLPDTSAGRLALEIDEEKRTAAVEVRLASAL